MNLTNLKLNSTCLGKKMLLVDIIPCYRYSNGVKTDDIDAYRYIVALPDMEFEKLGIKIDGEKLMDKPATYVEVTFDELELFIYWRAGIYDVGATAKGIRTQGKAA